MEWILLLKALGALAFVLGLLLVVLWGLKSFELCGIKKRFFSQLQSAQRITIEEVRRVDAGNSLVLVRKDDTEMLLLLGRNQNLLLEMSEIKKAENKCSKN